MRIEYEEMMARPKKLKVTQDDCGGNRRSQCLKFSLVLWQIMYHSETSTCGLGLLYSFLQSIGIRTNPDFVYLDPPGPCPNGIRVENLTVTLSSIVKCQGHSQLRSRRGRSHSLLGLRSGRRASFRRSRSRKPRWKMALEVVKSSKTEIYRIYTQSHDGMKHVVVDSFLQYNTANIVIAAVVTVYELRLRRTEEQQVDNAKCLKWQLLNLFRLREYWSKMKKICVVGAGIIGTTTAFKVQSAVC